MSKPFTTTKRAMTLPELMMALLLSVSALGVGLAVLAASLDALGKMEVRQRLQSEVELNLERIAREIASASQVDYVQNSLTLTQDDGSVSLWQIAEVEGEPMLLHGSPSEIATDALTQCALPNTTALSYNDQQLALTLSYKGQEHTFVRKFLSWAKTLP